MVPLGTKTTQVKYVLLIFRGHATRSKFSKNRRYVPCILEQIAKITKLKNIVFSIIFTSALDESECRKAVKI